MWAFWSATSNRSVRGCTPRATDILAQLDLSLEDAGWSSRYEYAWSPKALGILPGRRFPLRSTAGASWKIARILDMRQILLGHIFGA